MGDALGLALARAAQSQAKNKIIILLTDGVSNMGNTTPLQAAEQAQEQKVKIYTIGIGGAENAQMPIGEGQYKKYIPIPGGSFDFKILNKMADLTGGKSFVAGDDKALSRVLGEINQLEKTKINRQAQKIYQEKYWPYLFWGVLLLLLVEIIRRGLTREVM
ncbi:MAG: VWA domain-containing protein, partial [Pseudomonadota bacterium]